MEDIAVRRAGMPPGVARCESSQEADHANIRG